MVDSKLNDLKHFSLELITIEKLLSVASPRVTTGQIFENTNVFHREGLFSLDIFGDLGSSSRNRQNGHIDIKINILHPLAYLGISTMSKLHGDILNGKTKAIFDSTINDFIEDDNGETGFNFFINNLKKINFTNPNSSDLREFKIKLLDVNHTKDLLLSKVVVLAAGLRDYTIDKTGKPSQGEINDLYRSLINTSSMLPDTPDVGYNPFVESIRAKLQQTALDIYLYSLNVIVGKRGIIQGHLLSKTVKYGTRNVLTADNSQIQKLGSGTYLGFNNLSVGLYQHTKAISPMIISNLKKLMLTIFSPTDKTVTIIDNKTFITDKIKISNKMVDDYTTSKGLNSYLTKFADNDFARMNFGSRDYSFAVVKDTGTSIDLITDTSTVDKADFKYLRPVTNMELLYIVLIPLLDKYYATTTRYPAINQGSTFPAKPLVRPTTVMRTVDITVEGLDYKVDTYPIPESGVYDSMSIHHTKLARATADFDGDEQVTSLVL